MPSAPDDVAGRAAAGTNLMRKPLATASRPLPPNGMKCELF
jgi:hypothetical protein